MNKTLWKLERISEKIWLIASSMAMEASRLGAGGRGFSVVADETRRMALKINSSVEKAIFDEESVNQAFINNGATDITLLSFNAAIEAHHMEAHHGDNRGKSMLVCADDIRNLATEMVELLDDNKHWVYNPPPYPANKMTSIDNGGTFIHFTINGYSFVENLSFVQEILPSIDNCGEPLGTHLRVRGESVPVINCISKLGGKTDNAVFIRLRTPWAKTNGDYMIAVDEMGIKSIFNCPIGASVPPAPDMKLSEYARECWDSTDGEQFRFMDWTKLV